MTTPALAPAAPTIAQAAAGSHGPTEGNRMAATDPREGSTLHPSERSRLVMTHARIICREGYDPRDASDCMVMTAAECESLDAWYEEWADVKLPPNRRAWSGR